MMRCRPPDFIIGAPDAPYLCRWYVIPRNRWVNIYLHHFLRSDDDKALHDHPWANVSLLLSGRYREHMPSGASRVRRRFALVARRPAAAHRIELIDGPVWTLFITGPRVREWGFHCPKGWRHWTVFTNVKDGGATVGRGCDD